MPDANPGGPVLGRVVVMGGGGWGGDMFRRMQESRKRVSRDWGRYVWKWLCRSMVWAVLSWYERVEWTNDGSIAWYRGGGDGGTIVGGLNT